MQTHLDAVLSGLDAIFAAHEGPARAEPYLRAALADAAEAADDGARLTILNELMGFFRSQGRHDDAVTTSHEALALADSMGLVGTDAWATTLVNAATAERAAGHLDAARGLYEQALEVGGATMAPTDRRLAALHNNLSMLFSDAGDPARARTELEAALAILDASTTDPGGDLDVATTCTNLALVCFTLGLSDEAAGYVDRSLAVVRDGAHERDPHYAAVVAGHAEACARTGRLDDAVAAYESALGIVAECYGPGSDAYAVTAANLAEVRERRGAVAGEPGPSRLPDGPPRAGVTGGRVTGDRVTGGRVAGPATGHAPRSVAPDVPGLALARASWETHGRPLLESRYPHHRGRVAAGLVGHGSECYGFDDATSRDHDSGPGFCLWLTSEDYAEIGADLQADYDALPLETADGPVGVVTPRAQGDGRRVGVFEIGSFYEGITGYRTAPAADHPHEWLMLEEATLAAATNGAVFADPYGAFGAVRGSFTRMPRDVRLALVSRRLGMVSQAGQYNVPRMLDRGEGEAAWLSVAELARAVASLVFLLNGPSSAGYLPYYKWQPAALRRLSARMGSRLPGVAADLSQVLRLASTACFGGLGSGEGGAGAAPARARLGAAVERICAQVVAELQVLGLTRSDDTFLEHQRVHVAAHIEDSWLRGL